MSLKEITNPTDLETGLSYDPSLDEPDAIEQLADNVNERVENGILSTQTTVAC